MSNRKSQKYPINILIDAYGSFITKRDRAILRSSSLCEHIFEIWIYPLISGWQRDYLHDYYKDFLTIKQISEKHSRSAEAVEEDIQKAIAALRRHYAIVNVLLQDDMTYAYKTLTSDNFDYGKGLEEGFKEGFDKAYKAVYEEAYQKGYHDCLKSTISKVAVSVEELPDIPTEELKLPKRVYNCLKRENINTLKEIAELSPAQLAGVKNLGKTSYEEIVSLLRQYGLDTTMYETD